MSELKEIISNLKSKPEVDAVFLTGSHGDASKPYSDIDLVVILTGTDRDLNSLYTWIDGTFADIFFFDKADIDRIRSSKEISGNTLDAVLLDWLDKSTVQFDKSGSVSELKSKTGGLRNSIKIPQSEKDQFWQKINYNLVTNTRYFESKDPIYHEALEYRLLYSVSEAFMGYFEFRDVLWRGEKNAFKYLKENDADFHSAFVAFSGAKNLEEKFRNYVRLTKLVFPKGYVMWKKGDVFPQPKDRTKADAPASIAYWKGLISRTAA